MVQITSVLVAFILVAPSLAVPVSVNQESEDLAAREPLKLGKAFRKLKKFARPAASLASGLVLREDLPEAYERDLDAIDFEELAARDPSIKSFFRKVKNFVTKKNIHAAEKKVENVADRVGKVADLVLREDFEDLSERDFEDLDELLEREFDDEEDLFDRDLTNADFEELEARYPSFGSIFRKVRKLASPKNLGTVAKYASLVIREEDMLTEREYAQLQELAERDPSFGSWFRKIKHTVSKVVNPKTIGTAAKIASYVIREDNDVFERDYSDFEIDQLD